MAKAKLAYIKIEDKDIPVKVYKEWRRNARISLAKKGLNLRLPKHLDKSEEDKFLLWARDWIEKKVNNDPKVRSRLFSRNYLDGDTLMVKDRQFTIQIRKEARKTHVARLINDTIIIKLSNTAKDDSVQDDIRRLISRVLSAEYIDAIEKRVDEINDQFFQEDIKEIRLKYNRSNWGSCSLKKNINLSSRLLFAPEPVIDYVIIHELAHLKELNHSKKFWSIVSSVMPEYKTHEKWLKDFGHTCDF